MCDATTLQPLTCNQLQQTIRTPQATKKMVYLLKLSGFKNSEISLTYMVSDLYGHLALSNRDFDLYGEPYKSETTVGALATHVAKRMKGMEYGLVRVS